MRFLGPMCLGVMHLGSLLIGFGLIRFLPVMTKFVGLGHAYKGYNEIGASLEGSYEDIVEKPALSAIQSPTRLPTVQL